VKAQGYDLTKLREDVWDGHRRLRGWVGREICSPRAILGAEKTDRLLFVREMEPSRSDRRKPKTFRFTDYRKLAGGWIAARVEVHVEDRMTFSEEYSDIQACKAPTQQCSNPKQFNSTHWEKQ